MIVVKIQGGLGNQMFQFAFASVIAEKNKTKVFLDLSIYDNHKKINGYTPRSFELNIFNNQYKVATNKQIKKFYNLSFLNKIKKKFKFAYPKIVAENNLAFQPSFLIAQTPVNFIGYFQSYKYFDGFEDKIKQLFAFPIKNLSQNSKGALISFKDKNTVSVHIRRGDYVTDSITNSVHGCCTIEYYQSAISFLQTSVSDPTFVFFSDDSHWVKENFINLICNKIFIDFNQGSDSWMDMYLMTQCQHNIIANSSFSWWGAWLNNKSEKIVIAPKKWFVNQANVSDDLLPENWLKI